MTNETCKTSRSLTIELPYPPSINHYWGRSGKRQFIGKAGLEFRQIVCDIFDSDLRNFETLQGKLKIIIKVYPPDRRRRDIDNILKSLLDALEHAGAYENDVQIVNLHITKYPKGEKSRADVFIQCLESRS